MRYDERFQSFYPGLKQTSFIITPLFIAVHIAEMNVDSCNVLIKSAECLLESFRKPAGHPGAALDIFIGIDLNVHMVDG